MLTSVQNFLETIRQDGKPDRLLKQYEGTAFFPPNPASTYIRGARHAGMDPMKDRFGTTILWPEGQVAAMPHVTEDNKVISDITEWKDQLIMPDLEANCSDPALCNAIGEYRYQYMKLIVDHIKPDVMLSHDDWGSKNSLFVSPDTWREFIKPNYAKTYGYMKEKGVIIIHHADSFMEQIVEDMVDLGIDIWQGVLPENDIPKLQKQLNGRMTLMGGIDASIVDRADSTEEEIRKEVRRACETYGPGGHFIPCITYGAPGCLFPHVDPVIDDEIEKYNKEVYGI